MKYLTRKFIIITIFCGLFFSQINAQKLLPFRLPDTGQTGNYTSTTGEDADFIVNPLTFTDNGDGTITDNNTLLVWQKTDGGEMTFENAATYCNNLDFGGHTDWRLPSSIELLSINHYNYLNPAIDTSFFGTTMAQYWWTCETQADNPTKVWVVNAGGGIGAHPKTETISAGGTKRFHTRAVRNPVTTTFPVSHFFDNGDGTITDNNTGLTWQKFQSSILMTWEEALNFCFTFSLAGKMDWRLPNIKELQSLNDVSLFKPSFNNNYFPNVTSGNYWSSTTMLNDELKAWDINVDYGIVSYNDKTLKENVILVRGGFDNKDLNITEVTIPGGEYEMGDHNGHYDPSHPNDEIPIHLVKVDSMMMATTETTNQQFLSFLNSSLLAGDIEVSNNRVHLTGDTNTLYITHQNAPYYSIGYDGNVFSMTDFRANHPVVGVMWLGAAAYCNWLSDQNELQECYNLSTGDCDFSSEGYRLPTEAEWEFAGRGGHLNPYYKFPNGNTVDISQANLPNSGDPYEVGSYPLTTPVGFFDGSLKQKTDYNWPASIASYQTSNGANGFGLYDMQGNAWEFLNDWYGNDYYSNSPYDNPTGPVNGSIMPDGKPYRSMRGGNWYNGIDSNNVNDGHSRVSNRDPSYFRGPQDPNHPWYHVGFRTTRRFTPVTGTSDLDNTNPSHFMILKNFPNPFTQSTTIKYYLPFSTDVLIEVRNPHGKKIIILVDEKRNQGWNSVIWDGNGMASGIYFCIFYAKEAYSTIKLILIK